MDESGQIPYWSDMANPPKKVAAGQRFVFRRSGMDKIWREHCPDAGEGDIVRVIQMPGAPKPGTMGQVHIEDANTGDFLGMCSIQSLSTQTDELEAQGKVKFVKHNPPLNAAEDTKNRRIVGFLMRMPNVKAAEAGRMGTGEFFYEVEDTEGKVFRHKYSTQEEMIEGVRMFVKGIERDNPPLPASALIDITTAKTTAREVEEGLRPLGNLGTVDHLLDRSLQKLRGSHLGQVDWENPPEKLTHAEEVLLSAFRAQDTLSMRDIPGHYATSVADLTGRGLIAPVPGKKFVWKLTPKGRTLQNPHSEEGAVWIIGERPSSVKGHIVLEWRLRRSLKDFKEAEREILSRYPHWSVVSSSSTKAPGLYLTQLKPKAGKKRFGAEYLRHLSGENPGPGRIQRYRKPTSSEWVGRAMELQEEVVDLLTKFHTRGIVSLEELNLARRVMFLLKDIPLALRAERDNPPAAVEREIYRDIVEIKAVKPNGQRFVHKFGKGSNIYGMSDGTILIRSRKGKRLWKNFKVEG